MSNANARRSRRGEPCSRCDLPIDHDWLTTSQCRECHKASRRASASRRRAGDDRQAQHRVYSAPGVLTKAEAARRLGLSRDYVGRLANAGRLDLAEEAVEAERARRAVLVVH